MSLSSTADLTSSELGAARGPFGLPPLSGFDWIAILTVGLVPVAYAPFLLAATSSLRFLLMIALIPAGLVAAYRMAVRRDLACWVACAFLLATVVSSLLGPNTVMSLKGYVSGHASVLLYAACLMGWAVARCVSASGRQVLAWVLVATTFCNVAFGVVQIAFDIRGGSLATFSGRAGGFLANPAFYSSAVASVAALSVVRAGRLRSVPWVVAAAVMSFGIGISGARGGVFVLMVVSIAILIIDRGRSWVGSASAWLGILAGASFTQLVAGDSAAERAVSSGGDGRLEIWRYGFDAWLDRPLFGWGLGNHATAIRPMFTEGFVRANAWDDFLMGWNDPHNAVVLLLVSTGIIGTLLAGTFVLVQLRWVDDGAYLAGFLASAATWLLQPVTVHSLPVALAMLGLAARRLQVTERVQARDRPLAVASALGIVLAVMMLIPNAVERRALSDGNVDVAVDAARFFPEDPVVAELVAATVAVEALSRPEVVARAIEWSERPAEIEPGIPYWWTQHARRMMALQQWHLVDPSIDRALEINEWAASAWVAKLVYANLLEDEALAAKAREVVCRLDLPLCVTGSRAPDFSDVGVGVESDSS